MPRVLVRGNPARARFAAENIYLKINSVQSWIANNTPEDVVAILKVQFLNTCYRLNSWALLTELLFDECRRTLLIKIQAIWVNVDPDLCHHMASLGHTELIHSLKIVYRCNFLNARRKPTDITLLPYRCRHHGLTSSRWVSARKM